MTDDASPESPANGAARPPFAARYPRHEAIDRALAFLAVGNHRAMRALLDPLTRLDGEPEVAAAARDLLGRISPDPIAYVLLGATALLLATLTLWSLHESRAHREGATAPRAPPSAIGR